MLNVKSVKRYVSMETEGTRERGMPEEDILGLSFDFNGYVGVLTVKI